MSLRHRNNSFRWRRTYYIKACTSPLCVSAFICDANRDAHSQLTDGWREQMFGMLTLLPCPSHTWGVENRPICAHGRVSTHMHLMPHWFLHVCALVWRRNSDTEISLTGNRHLTYNYLMLFQLIRTCTVCIAGTRVVFEGTLCCTVRFSLFLPFYRQNMSKYCCFRI